MNIGVLDHVSIPVRNLKAAVAFYDPVLSELGLSRTASGDQFAGYGTHTDLPCNFWLIEQSDPQAARPGLGLDISFRALNRQQVLAFHLTALAHGGKDAGPPGPRPQYSSGFFGAFIFDPEGTKIEAVVRESLP